MISSNSHNHLRYGYQYADYTDDRIRVYTASIACSRLPSKYTGKWDSTQAPLSLSCVLFLLLPSKPSRKSRFYFPVWFLNKLSDTFVIKYHGEENSSSSTKMTWKLFFLDVFPWARARQFFF